MVRKPEFIITGIPDLDRELKKLERRTANRVARGALSKGASIGAKSVKKQIPSRMKSVRKAIGWSVKKGRDGITLAKIGTTGKRTGSLKRGKKHSGGVGISKQNVHWILAGTESRYHKSGKYVGEMSGEDAVPKGVKMALPTIKAEMSNRAKAILVREIQRRGG